MASGNASVVLLGTDESTGRFLAGVLEAAGFEVVLKRQGDIDPLRLSQTGADLVVLDLGLHRSEALELCLRLRRIHPVPIIMLGDQPREGDRILALELGADHFIDRPVSPAEFVARVRALLRRSPAVPALRHATDPGVFHRSWLRVDFRTGQAQIAGRRVRLTPRMFDLLKFFLLNPYSVHRRVELLDRVWGMHSTVDPRTVDAYVGSLRRLLEKHAEPGLLVTVRGVGYRCNPDVLDRVPAPRG